MEFEHQARVHGEHSKNANKYRPTGRDFEDNLKPNCRALPAPFYYCLYLRSYNEPRAEISRL